MSKGERKKEINTVEEIEKAKRSLELTCRF